VGEGEGREEGYGLGEGKYASCTYVGMDAPVDN